MDHKCPKYVTKEEFPYNGCTLINPNISCWVCDINTRRHFAKYMPVLNELTAWIEDGHDLSASTWEMLYEEFQESLDYGTLTGDTGTIDEWLCDRPEYVEDLITNIQGWCIEDVTKRETA